MLSFYTVLRFLAKLYHFRHKQKLYRAVLDDVFGGFSDAVRALLAGARTLPERIEAAVTASIDYGGRRQRSNQFDEVQTQLA